MSRLLIQFINGISSITLESNAYLEGSEFWYPFLTNVSEQPKINGFALELVSYNVKNLLSSVFGNHQATRLTIRKLFEIEVNNDRPALCEIEEILVWCTNTNIFAKISQQN